MFPFCYVHPVFNVMIRLPILLYSNIGKHDFCLKYLKSVWKIDEFHFSESHSPASRSAPSEFRALCFHILRPSYNEMDIIIGLKLISAISVICLLPENWWKAEVKRKTCFQWEALQLLENVFASFHDFETKLIRNYSKWKFQI